MTTTTPLSDTAQEYYDKVQSAAVLTEQRSLDQAITEYLNNRVLELSTQLSIMSQEVVALRKKVASYEETDPELPLSDD